MRSLSTRLRHPAIAAMAGMVLMGSLALHGAEQDPPMTPTNPAFHINELFTGYEDLRHPVFAELRQRYDLDSVVAGIEDEFDRILALRHWIATQIPINDDAPTRLPAYTAFTILDSARAGGGFHCEHFRIVQQSVLNAYGYVTRSLGVGEGGIDTGRHHGVNEVWVNPLAKWVLVDAKYDTHFEKAGIPLSALEIRDEVLRNEGRDVHIARGPGRVLDPKSDQQSGDKAIIGYRWLSWELTTARTSDFPNHGSSALILFDDEYSRQNTWYRHGKPHWAYDADFFIRIPRRTWIEWTPNVIRSRVRQDEQHAVIHLSSCTPNFARFVMQSDTGTWEPCVNPVRIPLPTAPRTLAFQSENLVGVRGPVHQVTIDPKR